MADFRKWYLIAVLLALLAPVMVAQNVYSAGVSYAPGAEQKMAGTALLARPIAGNRTAAFTSFDAVPTFTKPMKITTNVGAGIAERIFSFQLAGRTLSVWVPGGGGVSWSGTNVGWNYNAGGLLDIPAKDGSNFGYQPNVRFLKSSVNNNSDYQLIFGILFRYGRIAP